MSRIKVADMETALAVARLVSPTDCTRDENLSDRYDRPVYVSTQDGYDGFEIREYEKQLWVHRGENGEAVWIDVVGLSPFKTEELAAANKRIAEMEEDKGRWAQSHLSLAKACDEADKLRSDAQQRAEQAEAETMRLKAKLYDILIEGKG